MLRAFNERDASDQFTAFHSPEACKKLEVMSKGLPEIAQTTSTKGEASGVSRDQKLAISFAALRSELNERGLFRASVVQELLKLLLVMVPTVLGVQVMIGAADAQGTARLWAHAGAVLLAFGFQQAGWAGHDYSHHSVFASPRLNDAVAMAYAWLQGYEIGWWKARHNTHHVTTNEVGNDPDIHTAPVLTYMMQRAAAGSRTRVSLNWLQRQQHVYFVPLLALLHVYWRVESFVYVLRRVGKLKLNLALLLLNAALMAALGARVGYGPLVTMAMAKGLMTGVVVFATHYGEERLPKGHSLSFAEQTCRTSRNIAGGALVDLFTGNISRQVEHHLFPMMPRSNLPAATPLVREFCQQHGLPFNSDSLLDCVRLNIACLRQQTQ